MDELLEKLPPLLRDNLLAVSLGLIGFILLLYGLIAYVGFPKEKEPITFTTEDNDVGQEQSSKGGMVIDVAGAVTKPGVYTVKEDARFQDAILAAGGMSSEADSDLVAKQINLAAKLTDGAKVYVPFKGEAVLSAGGSAASGLININTAAVKELDSLPGIGSVTSEKIINARPYAAIEDLIKKKIVSQKVFDQVKEKISIY